MPTQRRVVSSVAACVLVGTVGTGCGDARTPVFAQSDDTGVSVDPPPDDRNDDRDDDDVDQVPLGVCASCDDDNPCTEDRCEAGDCIRTAVVSGACRPRIDVQYPPRGSALWGGWDDPMVDVLGTARSEAAPIASLTINGEPVAVTDSGVFHHRVRATPGGNILVMEVVDALGASRRRVQSFVWATGYRDPGGGVGTGMAPQGLGIFLAQASFDDFDRTLPPDDLATVVATALDGLDPSSLIDPSTPITHSNGYDVYLTDLRLGSTGVELHVLDGGLYLSAVLRDVLGNLDLDCTSIGCFFSGGDSSGGIRIEEIGIGAMLTFTVTDDGRLEVSVGNVQIDRDPNDVEIWSDNGWTDFLITIIEPFIIDSVASSIAGALRPRVETMLGPALGDAMNGLAFDTTFELPALDGGPPIGVRLVTDFTFVSLHDGAAPPRQSPPRGAFFVQRAGAYPRRGAAPPSSVGIPVRDGCGIGSGPLVLPRSAPVEVGITDDLLNGLFHAAWRGGLLELEATPDLLGDPGGGFISDLQVAVSGLLPPIATDCGPEGRLRLHIGDLRLVASLRLLDEPMTFTAYASVLAALDVDVASEGLGIAIADVLELQTELTVGEDENIPAEDLLQAALEDRLVDMLLARLGEAGALATIELPAFDVSAPLGVPPGTAVLQVSAETVAREPGVTVVGGHL